jgi:hypothetical protein
MIDSIPTLRELSNKSLKSKVAFRVARLLKAVQAESETFETARINLVKQYAAKDENGEIKTDENGNTFIEPAHIADFNAELKELLENTITINGDKLSLDDLGDETFTPQQMLSFGAFLEE